MAVSGRGVSPHPLRIAAIQSRPVWLDPAGTVARVLGLLERAAQGGAELAAFSETFLCGYPFWVCRTNGAAFNDPNQKRAYARYLETAVELDGPELAVIREAAGDLGMFVFLGVTERGARDHRGSTFCTLVAIHPERGIVGAHRKLTPTHDERLVWARGDGHGLRTHEFKGWRLGGLSCWENWMPLARNALYSDGIDIHVSTWPGWSGLTADITRFIALEGRVYSLAVAGLLQLSDVPRDFPMIEQIAADYPVLPFDGGSGIAGPDGEWVAPRAIGEEAILYADADYVRVREERLMFDVAGHYSRPDVFETVVRRRRLRPAEFDDDALVTSFVGRRLLAIAVSELGEVEVEVGGVEVVDDPVDDGVSTRAAATLHPVRSVNVFEETVVSILRLIKLGLVPPGERLPSERELSKQLEVSRPTVREALRSLAQTGYLKTLRGRTGGTYVLDWRPEPSDEQVRALAQEMGDELLDALDFRLVIETGAAALAAERCSADDAERLDTALGVLAAAPRLSFPAAARKAVDGDLARNDPVPLSEPGDPPPLSYRFADRRLHLLIADIASSPSVAAAVTQAQLRLSDLLASTPQMEEVLRHSDEQHLEIVAAIKRGDGGTAARVMREHVEATASYVRGFLG